MAHSMDRWVGKVAIVTGASSGIGAAVAERLVREGLTVVGLARRKERVDALASRLATCKGKLYSIKVDMMEEQELLDAFKWIKEHLGPIHILINNAGVGGQDSLLYGTTETWKQVINTNLLGLSIATREAIKDMQENKIDGHIVNIGSILGHYVLEMSGCSMYTATKHGVTAIAEALRRELINAKSRIKITNVSPGVVLTEITPTEFPPVKKLLEEHNYLNPEDISEGIVYVLSTPPHVQVHEIMIRAVLEDLS